jgi:hypothetical protein
MSLPNEKPASGPSHTDNKKQKKQKEEAGTAVVRFCFLFFRRGHHDMLRLPHGHGRRRRR